MTEDAVIDNGTELTPAERFSRAPRPLTFVRVRVYRGGQAEWLRDLIEDEQDDLFGELGDLREAGKPEDDPAVEEVRTQLRYAINVLRDLTNGLIELAPLTPREP